MDLDRKRREIDEIDRQIVDLLGRRAEAALEIGREKRRGGRSMQDNAREEDVIRRIRETNSGPLDDEAIAAIYQQIILACLNLQKTCK